MHPNKILCVLFGMGETSGKAMPIQKVAISYDKLLGGAIYENSIGFYNLKYVKEREKETEEKMEQSSNPFFDNLS